MDLTSNHVMGSEQLGQGITIVTDVAAKIRNKAKAKKAQAIADAGNYWTLTAFQKSLIPIPQYIIDQVGGAGVSSNAVLNLPAQSSGVSGETIISKLLFMEGKGGTAPVTLSDAPLASEPKELASSGIKKYLPYIIGVVVIGVIAFVLMKRK